MIVAPATRIAWMNSPEVSRWARRPRLELMAILPWPPLSQSLPVALESMVRSLLGSPEVDHTPNEIDGADQAGDPAPMGVNDSMPPCKVTVPKPVNASR